jgi:hypothetical protein
MKALAAEPPIIQREPFDYTKWQEHLFDGMTVDDLSAKAAAYRQAHDALVFPPKVW